MYQNKLEYKNQSNIGSYNNLSNYSLPIYNKSQFYDIQNNFQPTYKFQQSSYSVGYYPDQPQSKEKKEQQKVIQKEDMIVKYFMLCLELQRIGRANDQLKILNYDQHKIVNEIKLKNEKIKYDNEQKDRQIYRFKSENWELKSRLQRLQIILKEKQGQLRGKLQIIESVNRQKDQLMKQLRVKSGSLQNQLEIERNRNKQLLRFTNEQTRIIQNNKERYLQNQKKMNIRIQELNQQLKRVKQQYYLQIIQMQKLNKSLIVLKSQTDLLKTKQTVQQSFRVEIDKYVQETNRLRHQNEEYLKKINSLETYINQNFNNSAFYSQQINRLRYQLQYKIAQNKQLNEALKQQYQTIQKLNASINQSLYQKKQCKLCQILEKQNTVLHQKINHLEKMSKNKSQIYPKQSNKSVLSLKQLLESAKFLKGSNQRITRLLEISQEKSPKNLSVPNIYYKK